MNESSPLPLRDATHRQTAITRAEVTPGIPLHLVTDSELVFMGSQCDKWSRHKWGDHEGCWPMQSSGSNCGQGGSCSEIVSQFSGCHHTWGWRVMSGQTCAHATGQKQLSMQ